VSNTLLKRNAGNNSEVSIAPPEVVILSVVPVSLQTLLEVIKGNLTSLVIAPLTLSTTSPPVYVKL